MLLKPLAAFAALAPTIALALALPLACSEPTETAAQHEERRRVLLGTWMIDQETSDGVLLKSETTYTPDGRFVSTGVITVQGNPQPIDIKGTWKLNGNRLSRAVIESNLTAILPAGQPWRTRIEELSEDSMVTTEGGQRVTHMRKPAG